MEKIAELTIGLLFLVCLSILLYYIFGPALLFVAIIAIILYAASTLYLVGKVTHFFIKKYRK